MGSWGVHLNEVNDLITDFSKIAEILKNNDKAREDFASGGRYYYQLKKGFEEYLKLIQVTSHIPTGTIFYRVRKIDNEMNEGFKKISDLKYPPDSKASLGRANNMHSLNTMYTSFHELTAIAECRLEEGDYFQLTAFKSDTEIKYFQLGLFADAYLNLPRDSKAYEDRIIEYRGGHMFETSIRGVVALELALMDMFHATPDDEGIAYYLSALLADCMFSVNDDIDAIMYPSIQNSQRYGKNVTFTKKKADELKIAYTLVNKITKSHQAGLHDYITLSGCRNCDSEPLSYTPIEKPGSTLRPRIR